MWSAVRKTKMAARPRDGNFQQKLGPIPAHRRRYPDKNRCLTTTRIITNPQILPSLGEMKFSVLAGKGTNGGKGNKNVVCSTVAIEKKMKWIEKGVVMQSSNIHAIRIGISWHVQVESLAIEDGMQLRMTHTIEDDMLLTCTWGWHMQSRIMIDETKFPLPLVP